MNVIISALAAGFVAVLVTIAIEKLGGSRGGLLGTIPTTIVPASLGFYWAAETVSDFQAALYVVPAGMMLNALFLWFWREFPGRLPAWSLKARLTSMVAMSMSIWTVLALIMLVSTEAYRDSGFSMALWGWGFFFIALFLGTGACVRKRPAPAGTNKVGIMVLLGRAILAASAIGIAVLLATVSGPVIAGIVSVFPAIFFTTMVALWISQGESVPAGAIGPMMLGSCSVSAYALFAAWLMPEVGPIAGAIAAWGFALLFVTLPAWLFLVTNSHRSRLDPCLRGDDDNCPVIVTCKKSGSLPSRG